MREAMSAQQDPVEDPDTDAVSVTSTVVEPADDSYVVDCLIAEDLTKENCYLVKWENYPLHEHVYLHQRQSYR